MQFSYRVVDPQGKIETGKSAADSREKLIAKFKAQGKTPLEIKEETVTNFKINRGQLSIQERLNFTQQLAGLLQAGVPLEKALGILSKLTFRPETGALVLQLRRSLQEGMAFTVALERFPNYFPPLYINMIRAGEAGGILPQVLQRLAKYMEDEIGLRRFVIGSMIYPCIVLAASTMTLFFFIGYVIPKFETIFQSMGSELPLITKIVIFFGRTVFNYWWLLLIILAGVGGWAIKELATVKGRLRFDRLKLSLPLIGPVLQKVATAKMAFALSLLNGSGVPILTCLHITSEIVGNQVLTLALREVEREVKKGNTLSNSMAAQDVFPVLAVEMIGVGEESGNLGVMLEQVSRTLEGEVRHSMQVFLAVFEPVLILFMVGVIAILAVAILLPIINMNIGINI